MKLNFKKLLLIALFGMIISISNVNAAELTLGEGEKKDNTTKVAVVLKTQEEEHITGVKFSCEVDQPAKCEVKASTNIIEENGMYTHTNETGYPVNSSTTVAYVTITNTTDKQIAVTLKLTNALVDSTSVSPSKAYVVEPKYEEREASSNATFSKVTFSSGTIYPAFNPEVTDYTVYNISDTVNSVTVKQECDYCTFNLSGGSKTSGNKVFLNQGKNTVVLECESEDGNTTKKYTFTVIRGETSFNSSKLKELSFEGYTLTPAFDSNNLDYSLVVANKVNGLFNQMKYVPEDEKAEVDVKGIDNFQIGDNKIEIAVKNVSGEETTTYTITVKRLDSSEIQVIKYRMGEVTFKDSEGIENTLKEADFAAQYPEEAEKISNGTYKFDKEGNIVVDTPKDEEVKDDTKEEKKSNKVVLVIVLVIVCLAIIGVAGFFIFRKKKPTNNDDKKNKKDKTKKEDKEDKKDEPKDEVSKVEEEKLEDTIRMDKELLEEEILKQDDKVKDETMDIDEALSDLMSTKRYEFKDED